MVTKLETILKEELNDSVNVLCPASTTHGIIVANLEIYKLNQMKIIDEGKPNDPNQVGTYRTITTLQLTKLFKTKHEDFKKVFEHILKEKPELDIYEYARKRILLRILESITDVFGISHRVFPKLSEPRTESDLIIYVTSPEPNNRTMMLRLFTYNDKVDIELWDINGTPNIPTIL